MIHLDCHDRPGRLRHNLDMTTAAFPEANLGSADSRVIRLRDGRTLGYAEYGPSDGKPLLYFHGHPGSRFEARFLAGPAVEAGVRLIGVDRPGLGLSDYKAGRRLLDWPNDVIELADHLRINQFAVVGFSGGGPYALACACQCPQRLTAVGVVAGVGPLGWGLALLSQTVPWLMLPVVRRSFRTETQARQSLARFAGNWVEPDRQSLQRPGIPELMAASLVEALRPGSRGAAYDGVLLGRAWGFKLADIAFPTLYLWHGELDREVPVAVGRASAAQLARCQATFFPGEGHISVIANHSEEILKALTSSVSH